MKNSKVLRMVLAAMILATNLAFAPSPVLASGADACGSEIDDVFEVDLDRFGDVQISRHDTELPMDFVLTFWDMKDAVHKAIGDNTNVGADVWVIFENTQFLHLTAADDYRYDYEGEYAVIVYPQSRASDAQGVDAEFFPWEGGRVLVAKTAEALVTYLHSLPECFSGTAGTFLLGADRLPAEALLDLWWYSKSAGRIWEINFVLPE